MVYEEKMMNRERKNLLGNSGEFGVGIRGTVYLLGILIIGTTHD